MRIHLSLFLCTALLLSANVFGMDLEDSMTMQEKQQELNGKNSSSLNDDEIRKQNQQLEAYLLTSVYYRTLEQIPLHIDIKYLDTTGEAFNSVIEATTEQFITDKLRFPQNLNIHERLQTYVTNKALTKMILATRQTAALLSGKACANVPYFMEKYYQKIEKDENPSLKAGYPDRPATLLPDKCTTLMTHEGYLTVKNQDLAKHFYLAPYPITSVAYALVDDTLYYFCGMQDGSIACMSNNTSMVKKFGNSPITILHNYVSTDKIVYTCAGAEDGNLYILSTMQLITCIPFEDQSIVSITTSDDNDHMLVVTKNNSTHEELVHIFSTPNEALQQYQLMNKAIEGLRSTYKKYLAVSCGTHLALYKEFRANIPMLLTRQSEAFKALRKQFIDSTISAIEESSDNAPLLTIKLVDPQNYPYLTQDMLTVLNQYHDRITKAMNNRIASKEKNLQAGIDLYQPEFSLHQEKDASKSYFWRNTASLLLATLIMYLGYHCYG